LFASSDVKDLAGDERSSCRRTEEGNCLGYVLDVTETSLWVVVK
tara:strand:+ start:160 stop:291 length:132 start_codon:yes stop_codon:yes gene_type:complete